jgi:hypothetical protein
MESYKPRGYSVNDFIGWNQKSELVLQPRFQRREVWTPKARSYLIDTMLRQLPIPLIFIRQDIDPRTRRTVREVVDGQQRLRAVIDYVSGQFAILPAHNRELAGAHYGDLPDEAQRRLLDYELSVVVLVGATDADVLGIFARLNSYTERLTSQELLNAEFSGAFKQAVYSIGLSHLTFWRENKILSDREIVRMAEAELTSELAVAMMDGLQDGKKSLRQFYSKYDDEFSNATWVKERLDRVIDEAAAILGAQLPRTVFKRKAMFYSLYCVLYDLLFGLPKSPTSRGKTYRMTSVRRQTVQAALVELSAKFGGRDPEVADLRQAATSQTDRIAPRRVRHQHIWNACVSAL